jgi:hypothetical protein
MRRILPVAITFALYPCVNRLPNLTHDWSAPLMVDSFKRRF